jgi:hypothetical protein
MIGSSRRKIERAVLRDPFLRKQAAARSDAELKRSPQRGSNPRRIGLVQDVRDAFEGAMPFLLALTQI